MKIGIDVRMIFPFQTGIGNYRESLMQALFEIDKESEYVLVGNSEQQSQPKAGQPLAEAYSNVSFVAIKSKANHPLQHLLLPSELRKLHLDIFFTTHWGATLFMPCKYVLEIPDLIYHHYPEFGSRKSRLYEFFLEKRIARNADAVVTISNFVKNDIVTMLGVDELKVINIKGAVSEEYRVIEDEKYIDEVLKKYGLGGGDSLLLQRRGRVDLGVSDSENPPQSPFKKGGSAEYFVYLGNRRPHKNLVGLLQAFEVFRSSVTLSLSKGDGIVDKDDGIPQHFYPDKSGQVRDDKEGGGAPTTPSPAGPPLLRQEGIKLVIIGGGRCEGA